MGLSMGAASTVGVQVPSSWVVGAGSITLTDNKLSGEGSLTVGTHF